ncbi:MAG: hypothetical protein WBC20_10260 [Candidatus Aminicenantaceae bacterium]
MSNTIEVTPNVERCLEILREAVKSLPEGELKAQAEAAVEYLDRTAKGEPQPMEGRGCPTNKVFIPTG